MRELARIIASILSVYNLLILVRIFTTWVTPFRQSTPGGILDIIAKITDPFLKIFRKVRFLQFKRFDFTVLLALMSISIVQNLLSSYAYSGQMSVGYALATILQSLWWSIGSLLIGIIIVLLIVRLVLTYKKTNNSIQYIMMLNTWLEKILNLVHSVIFQGREISDRVLLYTSIVISVLFYIVMMQVVNFLSSALLSLPF
ncbi:MAG: YggT family protein [Sphaerochaetaceae bacterium]|nr:YggT family protein [Sphaerochaetaceae bacterium]MDC7248064.1 YggT family protein [Sphaerochaetaceae bacterium]